MQIKGKTPKLTKFDWAWLAVLTTLFIGACMIVAVLMEKFQPQ